MGEDSTENRVFRAVKRLYTLCMVNTLYTIMMDTCLYTFVQIHRMYSTKSEHLGKLWTQGDYDVSMQVPACVGAQSCLTLCNPMD